MGLELGSGPQQLRLGVVLGTTVNMCMRFASSRISHLHWSLGEAEAAKAAKAANSRTNGGGATQRSRRQARGGVGDGDGREPTQHEVSLSAALSSQHPTSLARESRK